MAFEVPGFVLSFEAGTDLSSSQFLLVELAADNQIDPVAAAAGNPYIGIVQTNPDTVGAAATVMISGVSKAVAGAAVTVADEVVQGATTAGRVETLAAGAGQRVVGRALASGAAGEIIPVLIGHAAPITHA